MQGVCYLHLEKRKFYFFVPDLIKNFNFRSPQLSASAVVNEQVLVELGKAFFGQKYSKSLRSSVSSHGFAPIPVYNSFLIDLDEVFSNFAVIKMADGQIQVHLLIIIPASLINILISIRPSLTTADKTTFSPV